MLIGIMLLTVVATPSYMASDKQTELDNLTKEQKQLQNEINQQTEKITDAQVEINTLNSTIASNQSQIEILNDKAADKQQDLDNQMENFKSTLALLQRMNNQNVMIEYLSSSDGDNFLLKFNNLIELSSAIQSNIQTVTDDLKEINSSLESIESYQQQNSSNQAKAESLLAEQQSIEDDLKAQLSTVSGDVTSLNTQISIDQAKALEENLASESAKDEEKSRKQADKEADNVVEETKPKVPEETEPEVPEVVEPEVPEVVEPEVPEVVEPEVPDPDSQYPSDGNVSSYKQQLMSSAGISSSDSTYVDFIITKESEWNYLATNAYSGAYGLCQALPGSKMSSSGSDWATNPETQISWCNSYAQSRYGSWQAAYEFWLEHDYW